VRTGIEYLSSFSPPGHLLKRGRDLSHDDVRIGVVYPFFPFKGRLTWTSSGLLADGLEVPCSPLCLFFVRFITLGQCSCNVCYVSCFFYKDISWVLMSGSESLSGFVFLLSALPFVVAGQLSASFIAQSPA